MKKNHFVILLITIFTVLITINSSLVFDCALSSMKNAISNIIPSLFPYMVISTMIVSSGAANLLGIIFPISKIYFLPTCASAPIIIGAICGFPLGARSSVELYEKGYLNKTETEVLISVANNTGPSFLIFVIGSTLWNDIYFGFYLYVMQLIASILSGLIINRLLFKVTINAEKTDLTSVAQGFTESLSEAVTSATLSSVIICGFITFFSIVNTLLNKSLKNLPSNILLMLGAILEFSEAATTAAKTQNIFAYFICGFSVGWSGLSVFCQTAGFTAPLGLSLKRCVSAKLLQGILLGLSCIFYEKIPTHFIKAECFSLLQTQSISFAMYIHILLIILCAISYIKKHKGA